MYPEHFNNDALHSLKELELQTRKYKDSSGLSAFQALLEKLRTGDLTSVFRALILRTLGLESGKHARQPISYEPEDYVSDRRIAVFIAMFGGYDTVRDPLVFPDNVDYYLITDSNTGVKKWNLLDPSGLLPEELTSPAEKNRWCRMHPHLIFPDHDVSIYVDSSTLITSDLTPLTKDLSVFPVQLFAHKDRDCVYQELTACGIKGKMPSRAAEQQKRYLSGLGVPHHSGLLETPVVVQDLHSAEAARVAETWWEEYLRFPYRDQPALVSALWKLGIAPEQASMLGTDLRNCDLFVRLPHGLTENISLNGGEP